MALQRDQVERMIKRFTPGQREAVWRHWNEGVRDHHLMEYIADIKRVNQQAERIRRGG